MRMRTSIAASSMLAAVSVMSVTAPAFAEEQKPEEMISEGAGLIINAIELMLLAIPTYEAPEVLPNGDIIIRRAKPGQVEPEDETPVDPGQEL